MKQEASFNCFQEYIQFQKLYAEIGIQGDGPPQVKNV